jgi:anthranilate phosphoribosyltransferase
VQRPILERLAEAKNAAAEAIDSGAAARKLTAWVETTRSYAQV